MHRVESGEEVRGSALHDAVGVVLRVAVSAVVAALVGLALGGAEASRAPGFRRGYRCTRGRGAGGFGCRVDVGLVRDGRPGEQEKASIRLASTVCDAARQHTRESWDAKKAEQAPSTLPLPQRSNPETVFHGKVIGVELI